MAAMSLPYFFSTTQPLPALIAFTLGLNAVPFLFPPASNARTFTFETIAVQPSTSSTLNTTVSLVVMFKVFVVAGSTMIGGRAAALGVGLAFGVAFVVGLGVAAVAVPEIRVEITAISTIEIFTFTFLMPSAYMASNSFPD